MKSLRQPFYQIYWSLSKKLSFEKSLLGICKLLRLFVNTLTADDRYCLLKRDQFRCNYLKNSFFLTIYFSTFEIYTKFWTFSQKAWPSWLMYFRNYGFRKRWLNQYLKSPSSEDPSKSSMVNGSKHCWNLNESIFTIFIDHCEGNWLTKCLC